MARLSSMSMLARTRAIAAPLLALLFALGSPTSAHADSGEQIARAHRFVEDGLQGTLAACDLPRTCGRHKPLRTSDESRESANDLGADQRRLLFDGMEIELLLPGAAASSPPFVLELTVTTAKWPLAQGLQIGSRRGDVERLLGDHDGSDDACVTYADADTQNDAMLCYAGDRLVAVKWSRWRD